MPLDETIPNENPAHVQIIVPEWKSKKGLTRLNTCIFKKSFTIQKKEPFKNKLFIFQRQQTNKI